MPSEVAIRINNISKVYYLYGKPVKRLFKRGDRKGFQALKDISLIVERGKTVGIIGRNGQFSMCTKTCEICHRMDRDYCQYGKASQVIQLLHP